MKIQKRLSVMALAAAIALGFTFPHNVNAKPDFEKGGPKIELTQEQKETAKKIFDAERQATAETRKALEAKKAELDGILKSDNPDKTRIQALSTEIGELKGKLMVSRAKVRSEMEKAGLPDLKGAKKDGKKDFDGKDFDKRPEKKGDRPASSLTEEQRATAKKIIDEGRAASADLRKEIASKKADLDALMKSATPDNAKIESLSKEIGELNGKLLSARVDTNAKLKEAGLPSDMFRKGFDKNGGHRDGKRPGKDGKKGDRGPKND